MVPGVALKSDFLFTKKPADLLTIQAEFDCHIDIRCVSGGDTFSTYEHCKSLIYPVFKKKVSENVQMSLKT